jgi:hypothetical protein
VQEWKLLYHSSLHGQSFNTFLGKVTWVLFGFVDLLEWKPHFFNFDRDYKDVLLCMEMTLWNYVPPSWHDFSYFFFVWIAATLKPVLIANNAHTTDCHDSWESLCLSYHCLYFCINNLWTINVILGYVFHFTGMVMRRLF